MNLLLAGLLVGASFLSGLAMDAAGLHVRPEQAIAPLVAFAVLLRPVRGRVAVPTVLAVVFLAAGLFGAFGEPEAGRAAVHALRLLATMLPVALLPLLLDRREAERAWDLFLLFALLTSAVALGALESHAFFGSSWGVTVEERLGYVHPQGTLLEPNILGALAAAAGVAFLLRVFDSGLGTGVRLGSGLAFLVVTAAVGASMTRAAWLALPLAGVVALGLLTGLGREPGRRARSLAAALAAGGLAVLLLATLFLFSGVADVTDVTALRGARTGLSGKVASILRPGDDPNVRVRLRSYAAAFVLFRERPLLGAGHGAMERMPGSEDHTVSWAGNLEIHLLADSGLTGCLAVAALCAVALARALRRAAGGSTAEARRRALERAAALGVVLLCAQATETSWLASFWVLLGLVLSADSPEVPSRPLKVLFVHPSDELYGSDRVLLELIRGLPRERVTPLVLLSSDVAYAGRLSARLDALGVRVLRFRLGVLRRRALASPLAIARLGLDAATAVARVAWLCIAERVDVVHANTVTVGAAAFAARLAGRPLVWHVHEIVPERRFRGLLLRAVDLLATRVVTVSGTARAALGPAAASAEVVENGVALSEPAGAPEAPPVVLFVGRLAPRKGPDVLLAAAGLLSDRHPGLRVVFAGDEFAGGAGFRTELDRMASELGIAERVSFLPFLEEIAPQFARATVVASPSRLPESFGLSILEAMAAGRPVVASALGGPAELIEDGVSGLLVPPDDPRALADAIDSLLSDPERAAAIGRTARARAATRYPVRRVATRFLGIYEELSESGAVAPAPCDQSW